MTQFGLQIILNALGTVSEWHGGREQNIFEHMGV